MKISNQSIMHIIMAISEAKEYEWDEEFKLKYIFKRYEELQNSFSDIDFEQLQEDELLELGFRFWDDDIILIPLWLLNNIKDGTIVISISGKVLVKGKHYIDKDVRCGCLALGFLRKYIG